MTAPATLGSVVTSDATVSGPCQCSHQWPVRGSDDYHVHNWTPEGGFKPCTRDAVRMVTVPPKKYGTHHVESDGFGHPSKNAVPMCSECAAYHERSAAK